MALPVLAIHELTEAVLGCVCAALEATSAEVEGQPGCPDCRTCVVPGQVAWDGCEDPCTGDTGGQLSVSVVRLYRSTLEDFPTETSIVLGVRGCVPPQITAVELAVTLLRCAPSVTEEGCPPSCDELAAAAKVLHVDEATVYNAMLCCLPDTLGLPRARRFSVGTQKTVGPQGGCVGLEQRVTVALVDCACPAETEGP
ncbi:hypothetical protein [Streptomyces sp. NRRL S-350]|uniref:hypothetical protein n=1 Tax=Streptomyces sp. NRRL S-350 TaxID=1463902 RepID=UPI0004BEFEC4|nr:hypothetical protein [Streptomyces sp. NRRL S-350]